MQESFVPLYTYHPPQAYDLEQVNFQCYQTNQHLAMMLDRGKILHQQQLLADEWEHQVHERQIARERLQAEATVELLNRWSVQQTVSRLR